MHPRNSTLTLGQIDQLSFLIPDTIISILITLVLLVVILFIIVFSTSCWRYFLGSSSNKRISVGQHPLSNMKRNQRIMIGLILLLLIIQVIGLIFRCICDSVGMSILSQARDYVSNHYASNSSLYLETFVYENSSLVINDGSVIPYSKLLGMSAMLSFELFFTLSNMSVLMLIMCFIGNVFLRTVQLSSTQTTFLGAGYKTARVLFNVVTAILSSIVLLVMLTIAIMFFFTKLNLVPDIHLELSLVAFSIFIVQIGLQLVATIIISLKVLQVIKANRSHHQHNDSQTKQAFIKVVVLQITLTLCADLQVVAMAFGAVISEWVYFNWFYLILNNFGILLFAVVSLALYHPIFHFKSVVPSTTMSIGSPSHQHGKSSLQSCQQHTLDQKNETVMLDSNSTALNNETQEVVDTVV
ncbi:hypothetical protein C9374_008198 [Naegleria lovaniensis]|uniref:Uncharacterized protein n=1 Tax=Naegleria lovaniensis TaxID=51637 RepID=A0AA88GJB7_NAELO|nr:uncharacterized protein C9374_008198 [Naegleria lovaniensis]KAG2378559.1 hypothetical protein C9374_008198 [Naegleria lovaniensis]